MALEIKKEMKQKVRGYYLRLKKNVKTSGMKMCDFWKREKGLKSRKKILFPNVFKRRKERNNFIKNTDDKASETCLEF